LDNLKDSLIVDINNASNEEELKNILEEETKNFCKKVKQIYEGEIESFYEYFFYEYLKKSLAYKHTQNFQDTLGKIHSTHKNMLSIYKKTRKIYKNIDRICWEFIAQNLRNIESSFERENSEEEVGPFWIAIGLVLFIPISVGELIYSKITGKDKIEYEKKRNEFVNRLNQIYSNFTNKVISELKMIFEYIFSEYEKISMPLLEQYEDCKEKLDKLKSLITLLDKCMENSKTFVRSY